MMRKLFIALLALVLSAPSFAQTSSGGFHLNEESVYYGVRFGLNVSTITGDELMKCDGSKAGMNLGGVVGFRLSDQTPVYLESGLYYSERGGKKEGVKRSLNYLEIPVLVKYGISTGSPVSVIPFLGPYFSYAIGGEYKDGSSSFRDERYKHGDMGFKVGCGLDYSNLYLEVGYQLGVTNISKLDNASAHTGNFNVSFGVNF